MSTLPRYVLVTPARNEAAFIRLTLESVVSQTAKPVRWIIVSDGSTDGTDEIVREFASQHDWIELLRMPERKERHFAGKVNAFNAGCSRLAGLEFEVLGNLDADISFEPGYFEFLLQRFAEDDRLGVAGTPYREGNFQYDFRFTSADHVSGACQLFRRACFESIGGYRPLREGGVDLVAVVSARMGGWRTRTFTERFCRHHRTIGTGKHNLLSASYHAGYHDYLMGVHPVWQFARSVYQMKNRPFVLGGTLLLAGYLAALLTRPERPVSPEFVRFRQQEQMTRLRKFLRGSPAPNRLAESPAAR